MNIELVSPSAPKLLAFSPAGLGAIVTPRPVTARELFAAHPDVVAAIGGPMFSFCEGEPRDYGRYQCGAVDYKLLDRVRGASVAGKYPRRGATLSLVRGEARVLDGDATPAGADVAIQGYPAIVRDGAVAVSRKPPTDYDGQPAGRVAYGTLSDGRAFFAYSYTSIYDFALQLIALGAYDAIYTDGGGSSSLVMRMPDGSLVGSDADDPGGRRLPSWVVWSQPAGNNLFLVGSTGEPAPGGDSSGVAAAAAAAAVIIIAAAAAQLGDA